MAFTKIAAAGIGSTELVTLHSLEVLNNATVGGVLTYEDVTNVDSIGIITARAGVKVGSGITLSSDGDIFFTGIMTGNGSGLTGVASTDNIRTNTNATFLQNVNVSGTATVSDNVDIATSIRHIGDTDTKISFDTNIIHLDTNNTERLRITSAGLVGVGTDTPYNAIDVVGSSADILIYDNDAYSQNVSGGALSLAGNDSAGVRKTLADVRGVSNGSNLGEFAIRTRHTGGTLTEVVRITSDGKLGVNIGTPGTMVHQHESSSGANYHKFTNSTTGSAGSDGAYIGLDSNEQFIMWTQETGKLRFAVADSERVYINNDGHLGINDGNLVIGTSGHGIDFSATSDSSGSNSSELFDDYEEGTFTISLANVNAPTYEARGGTYVKIGKYVFIHGTIGIASGLDTSDGSGFQPSNLPFNASGEVAVTLGRYTNLLGSKVSAFTNVRNTGTGFILLEGHDSNICYNEINSSGYLNFTAAYMTS